MSIHQSEAELLRGDVYAGKRLSRWTTCSSRALPVPRRSTAEFLLQTTRRSKKVLKCARSRARRPRRQTSKFAWFQEAAVEQDDDDRAKETFRDQFQNCEDSMLDAC